MNEKKLSLIVLTSDEEFDKEIKASAGIFHIYSSENYSSFKEEFVSRRVDMAIIDLDSAGEISLKDLTAALKLIKDTPLILKNSTKTNIGSIRKMSHLNLFGVLNDTFDKDLLMNFLHNSKARLKKVQESERKFADQAILIKRMNLVQEISRDITSQKPLMELLTSIMEGLKVAVDSDASSILLYDDADQLLQFYITMGEKGDIIKGHSLKMNEGIGGWVAYHRKSLIIDDCYEDTRFNPEFDKLSDFKTKSMLCVPMIFKDKLVGVIQALNKLDTDTFDDIDLSIAEVFAAQSAVSIENTRLLEIQVENQLLQKEIDTARIIQERLLPKNVPNFDDIDVSARLIPAKQVAGDYYNILRLNEYQTLFVICDVTGKSIPAALIVSSLHSALLSLIQPEHHPVDLSFLAKSLNQVLLECTTQDKFVTAWLGIFDHRQSVLVSVNAGHNNPYILSSDGNILELSKGGLMLGVFPSEYDYESHKLKKGDAIISYTDGVTEAMNKLEEEFGEERLLKLIRDSAAASTTESMELILNELKSFTQDAPQSDDITCILIKLR